MIKQWDRGLSSETCRFSHLQIIDSDRRISQRVQSVIKIIIIKLRDSSFSWRYYQRYRDVRRGKLDHISRLLELTPVLIREILTGSRSAQDFSTIDEWRNRDSLSEINSQVLREEVEKRRVIKIQERNILSYHLTHTIWQFKTNSIIVVTDNFSITNYSYRRHHGFTPKYVELSDLWSQEALADKILALEKMHTTTNSENVRELCRADRVYVRRRLWGMRTALWYRWMNRIDMRN